MACGRSAWAHAGRLAGLADMAHRVAFRRFDLDHVGALVGQQHGAVGPEDDVGEVDDPDAFERAGHCPVLCWERPRDCHRLDLASRRRKLRRKTGRKSWMCAPRCAVPRAATHAARRLRPAPHLGYENWLARQFAVDPDPAATGSTSIRRSSRAIRACIWRRSAMARAISSR